MLSVLIGDLQNRFGCNTVGQRAVALVLLLPLALLFFVLPGRYTRNFVIPDVKKTEKYVLSYL